MPSQSVGKHASVATNYGKLPLSFEANEGQVDRQVRFLSHGNGYSLFLTDSAAVLSLRKPEPPGASRPASKSSLWSRLAPKHPGSSKPDVVRMELAGASHDLHVTGDSQLAGTANYFIGNDPAKWHSAVPTYARVKYDHVYPGVDLVYYGDQSRLEYDFLVAPDADPEPIKLHFAGAKKLKLNPNGDLEVIAENGQVVFHKPVVYQTSGGRRQSVKGGFRLLAENTVAFALGSYDHSRELVIDPTLAYSTYLGGSTNGSYGAAITVDSSGDAYVTGVTYATDFPVTTGAVQGTNNQTNAFVAFVTKLNSTGTALVYSTYLGGTGNPIDNGTNYGDASTAIVIDPAGAAYLAGNAYSIDFPTSAGALQTVNKGAANGTPNCFVTKINPAGTGLLYSTYLGGSGLTGYVGVGNFGVGTTNVPGGDGCSHLAIDGSGNAYVAGIAFSTDFPTTAGSFQSANKAASNRSFNAFVSKLNPAGTSLVYSTYLGGSLADGATNIALDSALNAYITGSTASTDFPVSANAIQPVNKAASNGLTNIFVTKMNADGSAILYSTYLGGSGNVAGPDGDAALNIALDSATNIYVSGVTASQDFPVTPGAFQSTNKAQASIGGTNLFISKIDASGSALSYSTYLGSSFVDLNGGTTGMTIDASGNTYLTGSTLGTDFPITPDAYQSVNNCSVHHLQNVFLSELNATGSGLVYSTYLGGSGFPFVTSTGVTGYLCDTGYGIALDGTGNIYLTGNAESPDFPVTAVRYKQPRQHRLMLMSRSSRQEPPTEQLRRRRFLQRPGPIPRFRA